MASEVTDSITRPAGINDSSSSSASGNGDTGDFECHICFELAQDPIITLCGHLFCWPCLYRWLRLHSHSHECPVCKALIQEEKLIPLYGRGTTANDPRTKPVQGVEIPNRTARHRPETAPPPPREAGEFQNFGFGLAGGFLPVMTAGFGNFAMSAGFGGFLPSMQSIQIHGFANPRPIYGTNSGVGHGYSGGYHGADVHRAPETSQGQEAEDNKLTLILLLVLFVAFISCMW